MDGCIGNQENGNYLNDSIQFSIMYFINDFECLCDFIEIAIVAIIEMFQGICK